MRRRRRTHRDEQDRHDGTVTLVSNTAISQGGADADLAPNYDQFLDFDWDANNNGGGANDLDPFGQEFNAHGTAVKASSAPTTTEPARLAFGIVDGISNILESAVVYERMDAVADKAGIAIARGPYVVNPRNFGTGLRAEDRCSPVDRSGRGMLAASVSLAFSMLLVSPAVSLPRNPERPMNATTCAEAEARLREAEAGSPLISRQRNREIVAQARAQVARLCGDRRDDGG